MLPAFHFNFLYFDAFKFIINSNLRGLLFLFPSKLTELEPK